MSSKGNHIDHSRREEMRRQRKRAAKLRRSEERATGESVPARVWLERVKGSPNEDLSTGFTCRQCGAPVTWEGGATAHRNHCHRCLCSVHLDVDPGDRAADCGGLMDPIAVWVRKGGEWAIVHRCRQCGALSSNRIAADDNPELLVSVAMRPIASPPFPLEIVNP